MHVTDEGCICLSVPKAESTHAQYKDHEMNAAKMNSATFFLIAKEW